MKRNRSLVSGVTAGDRERFFTRTFLQEKRYMIREKRKINPKIAGIAAGAMFGLAVIASVLLWNGSRQPKEAEELMAEEIVYVNPLPRPEITEEFLTPNEYSRPQEALEQVDEIFIHYTENPGTSAEQNRNYFENLGISGETYASAHFIIGIQGEILQCLPLDEIGYAVKEHNYNSISIECCHPDKSGKFTAETRESLIWLTAWLLREYDLGIFQVKRHYDTNGKMCPAYYVENQDEWEYLLADVDIYIENMLIDVQAKP